VSPLPTFLPIVVRRKKSGMLETSEEIAWASLTEVPSTCQDEKNLDNNDDIDK
jgi:hypothetical protein